MIATNPATGNAPDTSRIWHPARALSAVIFTLASLIGVLAFISPFFMPNIAQNTTGMGGQTQSPLLLAALLVLSLAALVIEAQGQAMNAKVIALLGVLVAINSALRFAETVLPGPGGIPATIQCT